MIDARRLRILIFSTLAVAALLILASGLSQLRLLPGIPFPTSRLEMESIPYGAPPVSSLGLLIIRILYFFLLACLPIVVIYLIVSPQARRMFLRYLLATLVLLVLIYLAPRIIPTAPVESVAVPVEDALGEPGDTEGSGWNFVPNPSEQVVFIVSIVIAVMLALFLVFLIWRFTRPKKEPIADLERIAQEAQTTLEEIRAGGDLRNSVIRCYARMTQVLRDERDIQREDAMTPREFEALLIQKRLPEKPVKDLTRVFEAVRYGSRAPLHEEELLALNSLSAIIRAIQRAK